ncbi:hypothetical protein TrRE_jg10664 [Triparma retinervis]|uniref:Uncharacterized protein n=1 Tax=Triparma retinervis TaxID=2557542 RepID=A0A9W7DMT6_9STRA|nr:hypothetical protein TrRE_jg10664 [Triparma retinervis]
MTRRVVTKTRSREYRYKTWKDGTTASVWKRGKHGLRTPTALFHDLLTLHGGKDDDNENKNSDRAVPLTKLSFSKILVFQNPQTRADYFSQQQSFIHDESTSDLHYDFSSEISVPLFVPKILAVRTKTFGVGLAFFWIATMLGLSVPYRSLVTGWSDELNVQIVKEVNSGGDGEGEEGERNSWAVPRVSEWLPRTPFWRRPDKVEGDDDVRRQFESN